MQTIAALMLLGCGCGRVAFDPRGTGDGGTGGDGAADTSTPVDAGLPAGLVAWYPFEPAYAELVAGRDGTCPATQCPTPTAGHRGQAYVFDGIDDCVTVIDDGAFQLPTISLTLWARQDVAGTMSHIAKRVLAGSVNSWQLETDPVGGDPNTISLTTYDGSGLNQYAISPLDAITIGTWHHIAGTFDGSTKRVYVDGSEVTFVGGNPALVYDSMAVKIGCDDNAPEARFFNGALDEIQIYDHALTATEIADLAAR